ILDISVFLDGDWCWSSNPFQVTEETKKMVIENICFLLNQFINCSAYENIIFCWVMHKQEVIDNIVSKLNLENYQIKIISLVCGPKELIKRLNKDIECGIRTNDVLNRSLEYLLMYKSINSIKIDVSNLAPKSTAEIICSM
ncbi:MAG: nucleotide kinase, partial [Clostridia bacterium]|nr:nucleotide kinase [Clostridia bacterium]